MYSSNNSALLPHLNEVARVLRRDPTLTLRVEGHTDSDGAEEMNQQLSEKRAVWVMAYLSQRGVPQRQISTDGYGEHRPLFRNTSAFNKSRNRRVELILLRPHQPLPPAEGMR